MPTDKTDHNKPKSTKKSVSHGQAPTPDSIPPKNIPKIDDIEGIEANEIARNANKISRSAVIINGLILLVTAAIASVAIWQYRSADSAAKTAKNTFEETKKFDSITLENQKITDKKTDSAEKAKFKRDTDFFAFQKTIFEKENEPYLQIGNIVVTIKDANIPIIPTVQYSLVNEGKYPLKLVSTQFKLFLDKDDLTDKRFDKFIKKVKKETYVDYVMGGKVSTNFYSGDTVNALIPTPTDKELEFVGEIKYINIITKKNKIYKFGARVAGFTGQNSDQRFGYNVFYSENIFK
jgi:hypothetical protein